ncbi:YfcC family protein [Haloimpatiens sp. FM7315]|uniref:YfcC family protein n=1 Tax=Haloimpatiens sp. FM7315 TaxID=3298609 RepID=UPI00370AE5A4
MKKKFKMPSAFAVLFLFIIFVAILTWFIPAGKYEEGVYKSIAQNPQGIYNVISAPIQGFFDAIDIALFVIVIGGFLGIVLKTGAIDSGIGSIIKKLKGKEIWLIPILMILFGIGGTTYGMSEETIALYPILIPVFIAAGYDAITGVAVILLGAGIGCLASTVNPFATGTASEAAGIALGNGILLRTIMFIVLITIGIIFVMKYAKKVKNDPSKSIVANLKADNEKHFLGTNNETPELTKRRKVVLFLFALTFVVMIIGVIPWAYKFKITFFENIYNKIASLSPIFGLQANTAKNYWEVYDSVKTHSAALGDWWFGQMTVWFFFMSILIGIISKMKEKDIASTFISGAKDLLGVALIIGISRGIKVVMVSGGMDATILYWNSNALKGLNPGLFSVLSYIFYIPMSFLIPSTSGLAGATMPVMAPLAANVFKAAGLSAELGKSMVITAYQSASGIVNLITPTSGVVMGALALGKIPFEKWIKFTAKLLGIIFVVTILFIFIGTLF